MRIFSLERLILEKPRQILVGCGTECAQKQVLANVLLMFGNRLLPISVSVNGLRVATQLQGGESQDLLLDLQWRLSGKPPENAHEGDLVRKSKPVAGATAKDDLVQVGLEKAGVSIRRGRETLASEAGKVLSKGNARLFWTLRVDLRYLEF